MDFLHVRLAAIYLLQHNELVLRAWQGFSDEFRAQTISFSIDNLPVWIQKPGVFNERLNEKGILPDFAKKEGIQTLACIPLYLPSTQKNKKERWPGTIIVASRHYEGVSKESISALTSMTHQLAMAIDHFYTSQAAQERLIRLQTLREIDRAIIQHLELKEVLNVVLKQVPKKLGADAVAISLMNEEQTRSRVFAMRFPNGTIIEKETFAISESLLHWFVDRQRPVIIYNLHKDPRVQMHRTLIHKRKLVSYLGVPLVVRNKTIGILHILTTKPKVFTDEDIEFFHTLGGQAAIAIENAQMYAEIARRAEAVEEMLRTQLKIVSARPEHITQVILESLQRCIGIEKAGMFRYKEKTRTLILEDAIGFSPEVVNQARQSLIFRLGEKRGLVGLVALTHKSLYLPDCQTDPRWVQVEPTICSAYLVPLVFGRHLFGVIILLASERYAFPAPQRILADLFAHYAGAALETARLLTQIQEAERQYRSIFENANEGIFQLIPSGGFIRANPALARILGYDSPEEVIRNITDTKHQLFVEPNSYEEFVNLVEKYGLVSNFESQIYNKDNRKIWVSINAHGIRDVAGTLLYCEGTIEDITRRKRAEKKLRQTFEKLQAALEGTVYSLASAFERRDPYTAGHQRRVTNLACAIAKEMGLSQKQIQGIRMAGLIHDLGKIYVPSEILSRPGQLTESEFNIIKTHPEVGYQILKDVEFPWPVAKIILQHHERMNGSGYPQGLSGDEILLEARILAVADAVEAMSSHRPYRPALGIGEALGEILKGKGVLYAPEVVDTCVGLFTEKRFTFE
ncbi:hypothetical protein DRJ04_08890 [Candidatus Aerophobetes bacterium]|uniref:PAS domain S-box protein n=1 Tax=Aerophobetes bacterium TaxID=2030807 RepID=A0A662D9Y8_UNCAE|nr:MAG: hypothetical protein DRJ04_08890 [Candidatus Aerophobetes bacterium]